MLKRAAQLADRLQARMGPLWWYSLLLFGVSRAGDLINLYIGAFLVPDAIHPDDMGAILPVMRLATFVGVPVAVISGTAMKYLNVFFVAGRHDRVRALLRDLGILSSAVSVAIAIALAMSWAFVRLRLKVDDPTIAILLAATTVLTCWGPIASVIAQGLKRFGLFIAARAIFPFVRLLVAALVLRQLQIAGFLLSNVAASLATLAVLLVAVRPYLRRSMAPGTYRELLPEMVRYTLPLAIVLGVQSLQLAVEPWIIRQRLPAADSAGYYMAAMFGNIPQWVAPAMVPFLFPLVSERFERGESTRRLHVQALGFVAVVGLALSALLLVGGRPLLGLRPAWAAYVDYARFMWQIGLIATADALFGAFMTHENACRRFGYVPVFATVALLEVAVLYGLMGWPFFRGWLPDTLWHAVAACIRKDLRFLVNIMLLSRVILLLALAGASIRRKPA